LQEAVHTTAEELELSEPELLVVADIVEVADVFLVGRIEMVDVAMAVFVYVAVPVADSLSSFPYQ
jgi:hypothetical protein